MDRFTEFLLGWNSFFFSRSMETFYVDIVARMRPWNWNIKVDRMGVFFPLRVVFLFLFFFEIEYGPHKHAKHRWPKHFDCRLGTSFPSEEIPTPVTWLESSFKNKNSAFSLGSENHQNHQKHPGRRGLPTGGSRPRRGGRWGHDPNRNRADLSFLRGVADWWVTTPTGQRLFGGRDPLRNRGVLH